MALFSPSAQQALRALVYLARQHQRAPVGVKEIAEAESIPRPFLSKLLLSLRNQGIVRSTKGPGGGYALAQPAHRIRVRDVVATFDGTADTTASCVLGLPECDAHQSCALHAQWTAFRDEYLRTISSMSLSKLAASEPDPEPRRGHGTTGGRRARHAPKRRMRRPKTTALPLLGRRAHG